MKQITSNQIVIFQNNFYTIRRLFSLNATRVSLIFLFITSISYGQSNNCQANLVVENNGNIRSTPLEGTYYSMIITNTGSSSDNYTLSTSNINNSCINTDQSSTVSNVELNASIIDLNKNTITEITVTPGESVNFYIHITVPVGTKTEKLNCTQVTAKSNNCIDYTIGTILHSMVIDSNEDNFFSK